MQSKRRWTSGENCPVSVVSDAGVPFAEQLSGRVGKGREHIECFPRCLCAHRRPELRRMALRRGVKRDEPRRGPKQPLNYP